MKSSRRRLLTALTGLIALPVLPRAASITGEASRTSATQTLRDCFASQQFPQLGDIRRPYHFDIWEAIPRHPVTRCAIESREEFIRCELHSQKLTRTNSRLIQQLESALEECVTARRILDIQPTGRPLTFRYSGGTMPHHERTVLPTLLHQPREICRESTLSDHLAPIYLQAYCIERLAPRTFRLDRIKQAAALRSGDHRSPT